MHEIGYLILQAFRALTILTCGLTWGRLLSAWRRRHYGVGQLERNALMSCSLLVSADAVLAIQGLLLHNFTPAALLAYPLAWYGSWWTLRTVEIVEKSPR